MGIHDDSNKKPAAAPRTPESTARLDPSQNQQRAAAASSSAGFAVRGGSVMDINSRLRRTLGRNTTGEQVTKFVNAFREIIGDEIEKEDNAFRVLVLDSQVRLTALSAVVLALSVQAHGGTKVAAYTMIVEASGPRLNPITANIGGQQVELEATAGDTADNLMWKKVQEVVAEAYGPNAEIIEAGFNVLPKELDPADKERAHNVLYNAAAALQTTLDIVLGGVEEPFNVSWIEAGDVLSARVDYNPLPIESSTGLPVRSDVSILLNASRQNSGNQIHAASMDFSRVDGFVDLVYSPPGMPTMNMMPDTRHFTPRFVITNSTPLLNAVTMELQLLSLVTATILHRNMAWAGVFKPRAGAGIDLRDIGAIGLEMPILTGSEPGKAQRVDTKSAGWTNDSLLKLLDTAIRKELVYTMHVEETGDMSWIQQTFLAAASGHMEANQAILDAANVLTLGKFSQFYKGGPVVASDNMRVHLGYYVDSNGVKRDIRDIDYLALLNWVGDKDMSVVIDWCNTYDQTDVPLEIRLEKQRKILQNVVGDGNARFTGYARPVTFEADFIQCLAAAAEAAGLAIRPGNIAFDATGANARGNSNINRFAVGQMSGGMFNHGQSWNAHRSTAPIMGRWGR